MVETLVLIGIACVITAVAGGGLKLATSKCRWAIRSAAKFWSPV